MDDEPRTAHYFRKDIMKRTTCTTEQAAAILGISYTALRNHMSSGRVVKPSQLNSRRGYEWSKRDLNAAKKAVKPRTR